MTEAKGWLGTLHDAVFENEGDAVTSQQPPPATAAVAGSPAQGETEGGAVDQAVLSALRTRVFTKETPYASFLRTFAALEGAVEDPEKRFVAALKAVQASGNVTASSLATAVAVHQQALEREKGEFSATQQRLREERVGEKERVLASAQDQLARNREEIERLQSENTDLERQTGELQGEITSQTAELEHKQAAFEAACDALGLQLAADHAKLKRQR